MKNTLHPKCKRKCTQTCNNHENFPGLMQTFIELKDHKRYQDLTYVGKVCWKSNLSTMTNDHFKRSFFSSINCNRNCFLSIHCTSKSLYFCLYIEHQIFLSSLHGTSRKKLLVQICTSKSLFLIVHTCT
jgi:hypothetical protein